MALLSPDQQEQITAWINTFQGKIPGFGKAKNVKWIADQFDGNGYPKNGVYIPGMGNPVAFWTQQGLEVVPEAFKEYVYAGDVKIADFVLLQGLVSNGTISEAEASAYIQTKYHFVKADNAKWLWIPPSVVKDAGESVVTQVEEALAQAQEDGAAPPAQQVQQALGTSVQNTGIVEGLDFSLSQLPSTYNPGMVADVIEDALQVLAAEIAAVKSGAVSYPDNSIPGSAIIAGSLPPSKINPVAWQQVFTAIPPPEEAVELTIAPDPNADRFLTENHTGTEYVGPGRVWRVTNVKYPQGFNPAGFGIRYRLLMKGARLGVLGYGLTGPVSNISNLYQDDLSADWDCTYGMVLRGIPSLGRRPQLILAADYVGDVPASLIGDLKSSLAYANNTPKFFNPKAEAVFVDTPPTLYREAYNSAFTVNGKSMLKPTYITTSYLEDIQGLAVQLVKGETEEQVYAELCGRKSPAWGDLSGSPRGNESGSPAGIVAGPPMRSVCIQFNNQGTYRDVEDLAPGQRISDGMPLRYKDLAGLRRTTESFAVSLQAYPPRKVSNVTGLVGGNGSSSFIYGLGGASYQSNDLRPGNWPGVGIDLVEEGHRDFALDIIVL